MPKFTTISPTHIPGKKVECWQRFRDGGYVAIGWFNEISPEFDYSIDLTGREGRIDRLARDVYSAKNMKKFQTYNPDWKYSDKELDKIVEAFTKFFSLEIGGYVAVNNGNHGLFGIGTIKSGYKFEKKKHLTGSMNMLEKWYPHHRDVRWIISHYMKRTDIIKQGDTGWQPYGTIGKVFHELPPYIQRILENL